MSCDATRPPHRGVGGYDDTRRRLNVMAWKWRTEALQSQKRGVGCGEQCSPRTSATCTLHTRPRPNAEGKNCERSPFTRRLRTIYFCFFLLYFSSAAADVLRGAAARGVPRPRGLESHDGCDVVIVLKKDDCVMM